MVIAVLLQRLTLQSTSRCYSLFNIYKASRQRQLYPFKVNQIERLQVNSGFSRCKSDLTSGNDDDLDKDGKSSKLTADNDLMESKGETKSSGVNHLVPSMTNKYRLFENSEEELILDYREELLTPEDNLIATDWPSDGISFPYRERQSKFDSINLERGQSEVIDVDELVNLLHHENMEDTIVISLPRELRYTDYMVIASAKSVKQLESVTQFLVKAWKLKKKSKDPFLLVEGEDSPDWKTLDMRSIMVHLFMPETREKYDLESLWALGVQFDDLTQKPTSDPGLDLLEKQMEYLKNLKPVEPKIKRSEMIPIYVKPLTTKEEIQKIQRELIKAKSSSPSPPTTNYRPRS